MSVRIDGQMWDIEPPVRCFFKYDATTRANLMASHRQGHRARQRVGEFYYIHPLAPGIAFPSRKDALRAALQAMEAKP